MGNEQIVSTLVYCDWEIEVQRELFLNRNSGLKPSEHPEILVSLKYSAKFSKIQLALFSPLFFLQLRGCVPGAAREW